mmetsp:Transcript_127363/g.407668  ORF Transcript_127363/g.407668 Transcript_127363/m.407668 type:complete len:219 (+) Transcript_127363:4287-4943(+)
MGSSTVKPQRPRKAARSTSTTTLTSPSIRGCLSPKVRRSVSGRSEPFSKFMQTRASSGTTRALLSCASKRASGKVVRESFAFVDKFEGKRLGDRRAAESSEAKTSVALALPRRPRFLLEPSPVILKDFKSTSNCSSDREPSMAQEIFNGRSSLKVKPKLGIDPSRNCKAPSMPMGAHVTSRVAVKAAKIDGCAAGGEIPFRKCCPTNGWAESKPDNEE